MRHIAVDFNTLTSAPEGVVKFHVVEPMTSESYEDLAVGDRVALYADEVSTTLVVEAVVTERWQDMWLAVPERGTWHDVPLSAQVRTEQRPLI